MSESQPPDWVRDAVFYQIFPDRFARSHSVAKPSHLDAWGSAPTHHGYQGGDLVGVVERLDYLCALGINALYFTPIFQSASNHRYHTHDYEKVDPMLGGNAALRRLLDEAHGRGVRVVLDGVFNHASRGFFPFHDILENGQDSAYLDWFSVSGFPLNAYERDKSPTYKAWWGLPALPKFNTDTRAVREFLWRVGRTWVEFGIDGWRLDVGHEIDDDSFWQEFRRQVRSANPETYIVGEIWREAPRWVNRGDMWDAVMNYPLTRACLAFFFGSNLREELLRGTSLFPVGPTDVATFRQTIERLQSVYPWHVTTVLLNILGSHDMARIRTLASGDLAAVRLATLFQMTFPGAPSVYYGDEIGMEGGHDPDNRRAFPWDESDTWDVALLHDFQKLIALRHAHPALRRGSYTILHAANDVFAHARQLGNETLVAAFNVATSTRRVDVPVQNLVAEAAGLDQLWGRGQASVRVEQGSLRELELSPRAGVVYLHQNHS